MKKMLLQSGVLSPLFVPLRVGLTAIGATALLALSASPLHAASINCDAPGQNLQVRINATALGDRLDVTGVCDDGPYVIRQDIKLAGPATLSATAGSAGSVLTVFGAKAELRDITIIADNARTGLAVLDNGSVNATNIVVSGASSAGIAVTYSSVIRISSSTIKENRLGFNVSNASTLRLAHNTIVEHNTLDGINVSRASTGTIRDSRISHNGRFGIYVLWDANLGISNTEITNNGSRGVNIFLQSFFNFFDPPSTIESNGIIDVNCEGRSGFFANSTQISLTKVLFTSADCLDSLGAPIF